MAAAAELEAAKIRGGLIDPKDIAFRDHAARPLAEHLDEWREDMLAKGKTAKHADQYRDRAGKLLAIIKGTSPRELKPAGRPTLEAGAKKLASVLRCHVFHRHQAGAIQAGSGHVSAISASQSRPRTTTARPIRAFLRWAWDEGGCAKTRCVASARSMSRKTSGTRVDR